MPRPNEDRGFSRKYEAPASLASLQDLRVLRRLSHVVRRAQDALEQPRLGEPADVRDRALEGRDVAPEPPVALSPGAGESRPYSS